MLTDIVAVSAAAVPLQDTKLIAEQLAGRRKKLAAEGLSGQEG
jgi:hypothetical protein